jgi:sugar phosphate isomerase/epimerase
VKFGWAIWNMRGGSQSQADRCRLARELGLDFVSFNTSPLHWSHSHPGGEAASPGLLAELRLAWTVHAGLSPALRGETAFLDEIRDFAEGAGPPLAVSFDPVLLGEKPDKRYGSDLTVEALETAGRALAGLETVLALENSPRNCAPELFVPVVERCPGLGMLLDTGHLNMFLGADPAGIDSYLDALPLPIVDLHIHDNDGERDRHDPLGSGTLPYGRLFAALRSRGYDGLATLEVCPGLESLRPDSAEHIAALRTTLRLAREGLAA